jgi:hypothetical protein
MLPSSRPARDRPWRFALEHATRRLAAIVLAAVAGPAQATQPYSLGMGYPLPWLGLTAGGYATVRAGNLEGEPAKAVIKDLSLLLHADLNTRWHFFTELELGDPLA